ncbi:MAG: GTP-binding protein, partial [Bryobacteraceae bacterium]
EVSEATLILHVVDVSSPHAAAQTAHVLQVLAEIGAAHTPQLFVLNKVDRLESEPSMETIRRRILRDASPEMNTPAVAISASRGQGIEGLMKAIDQVLPFDRLVQAKFRIPASEGVSIHLLHELGRVLESRYSGEYCYLSAEVPESLRERLAKYAKGE